MGPFPLPAFSRFAFLGWIIVSAYAFPLRAESVPSVPLDSILGVIIHDWNEDGSKDRALLVGSGGDTTLYLREGTGEWVRIDEIAFGGGMMPFPSLSLNESGSLVVESSNPAVGRGRWEKRLIIAYRDGAFIVAGYVYRSHDTLREYPDVDFEVNYLSGKMILNGKTTEGAPRRIPLADWEEPDDYR